jgi:hypothetical protein
MLDSQGTPKEMQEKMAGRWKLPKEDRVDAEAIRRDQEFERKLRDVLEYGGEDDFVVVLKAYKPDITKEELSSARRNSSADIRSRASDLIRETDSITVSSADFDLGADLAIAPSV